MTEVVNFLLNTLNTIWVALISDLIKSISAFASIGAFIVGWKNLKKDTTRISVVAKRASNGPLILQRPREEFLLFEVYNQGISAVVINEIGIKASKKSLFKNNFINLVDLPHGYTCMKGHEEAIGTLECVGLPGTIPARSLGIFLLNYSCMRDAAFNYHEQNISPDSLDFVGSQRVIKTLQEFEKFENHQGKCIQITPYVLTGSGEHLVGKKSIIKLGVLGSAVA